MQDFKDPWAVTRLTCSIILAGIIVAVAIWITRPAPVRFQFAVPAAGGQAYIFDTRTGFVYVTHEFSAWPPQTEPKSIIP
jgi:hypothetical protein